MLHFYPDKDIRRHCKDEHEHRQHLRHRHRGTGDKECIRADSFYNEPPKSIAAQINQTELAMELFMLSEAQQYCKHQQIPHTLI